MVNYGLEGHEQSLGSVIEIAHRKRENRTSRVFKPLLSGAMVRVISSARDLSALGGTY